jgi:hypothetical protein
MVSGLQAGESIAMRRMCTVPAQEEYAERGVRIVVRRHTCVACQRRRSLFRYRGVVKADADHTLCFQCYRTLRDQLYARRITTRRVDETGM